MIAFVFPGQGSQYVGMGRDLYENFAESKRVFDTVDRELKFSLSKLCFDGPIEELTRTVNCQPAIFTVSLAALAAFKSVVLRFAQDTSNTFASAQCSTPSVNEGSKDTERSRSVRCQLSDVRYVAGLSLGEYTALVAAGALSLVDGVSLVANRARFMDEAATINPGRMSCILGLDLNAIKNIAEESGVHIANLNCPGQVVISGITDAVDKANSLALARGAKRVVNLDVSGAFHSSLMQPASLRLAEILKNINMKEPAMAVVSNVTAAAVFNPEQIKENLVRPLTGSVYWEQSVRFMIGQGVNKFFEIGPGKVLRGLIRKIDTNAEVINFGGVEDINKFAKGGE
jgi:[acyl-carrier-protein] S-malonyltransferase